MGKNMKEQKRSSKTIDIVSYALEVSVNGVTCLYGFLLHMTPDFLPKWCFTLYMHVKLHSATRLFLLIPNVQSNFCR